MKDDRAIADNFFRDLKKEEAEKAEAEKKIKIEAEKAGEFPVHTTKPMKEYTTEPVFNPASEEGKAQTARRETRGRKPLPRIVCPFCEEERKQKGVMNHISHCHGVPGFTVKDVFDVQDGVKSLEDLVYEKFDDDAEIDLRNLSPTVSKEVFGSWEDVEATADPVDQKVVPDNPGRKVEIKEPVEEENEYEWTCPDAPFPFNLLRRRKARKK